MTRTGKTLAALALTGLLTAGGYWSVTRLRNGLTTPVVFVHGFNQKGIEWIKNNYFASLHESGSFYYAGHVSKDGSGFKLEEMPSRTNGNEHPLYTVSLPERGVGDIRSSAEALGAMLEHVRKLHRAKKTHLVAYSLGGIVCREYLTGPLYRGDVASLTTIASPHGGSEYAWLYEWSQRLDAKSATMESVPLDTKTEPAEALLDADRLAGSWLSLRDLTAAGIDVVGESTDQVISVVVDSIREGLSHLEREGTLRQAAERLRERADAIAVDESQESKAPESGVATHLRRRSREALQVISGQIRELDAATPQLKENLAYLEQNRPRVAALVKGDRLLGWLNEERVASAALVVSESGNELHEISREGMAVLDLRIHRAQHQLEVMLRDALRSSLERHGLPIDAPALGMLALPDGTNYISQLNARPHPQDIDYTSVVSSKDVQDLSIREIRSALRGDCRAGVLSATAEVLRRTLAMGDRSVGKSGHIGDGFVSTDSQNINNIEIFASMPVRAKVLEVESGHLDHKMSRVIVGLIVQILVTAN